jgi:hypothetical protein
VPEVVPAASLDQLEMVRLFDYNLTRPTRTPISAASPDPPQ